MRKIWLLAVAAGTASLCYSETYTMTMKQAVDRALAQNPELVMSRLDELRAAQGVRLAKDPFMPKVGAGSGLAYTYGFPMSIEGSAPSIVQMRVTGSLYNKPQKYAIDEARESARGAGFATGQKRDEIVFRVASLYLDTDRAGRQLDTVRKQVESLRKVVDTVQARADEGRALPTEISTAKLDVLKAQQRLTVLESDADFAGHSLAVTLGYDAADTVRALENDRALSNIPENESAAVQTALAANPELKRLQSNYDEKALEIRSNDARKLPQVDLVGQYALNPTFNNFADYYTKFQTNNAEIGASISIPLFGGASIRAANAPIATEQQKLKAELQSAKSRIQLDLHQSYLEVKKADSARELAQADLNLARDLVTQAMTQMSEGRATLRDVEQARFNENEKWLAFYDAQFGTERARLDVLRQTGELASAVQ